MTIKIRLQLLTAFTVAVLVSLSALVFILLSPIKTKTEHVKTESLPFVLAASEMKFQSSQVQQFYTDVGATKETGGLKEADESAEKFLKEIAKFKSMYKAKSNTEALAKAEKIEQDFLAYKNDGKNMADAYLKDGIEVGNAKNGRV